MFKIKDNVELSNLEKAGFKKDYTGNAYVKIIDNNKQGSKCFIYWCLIPNPTYATIPRVLYICNPFGIHALKKEEIFLIEDLQIINYIEEIL